MAIPLVIKVLMGRRVILKPLKDGRLRITFFLTIHGKRKRVTGVFDVFHGEGLYKCRVNARDYLRANIDEIKEEWKEIRGWKLTTINKDGYVWET